MNYLKTHPKVLEFIRFVVVGVLATAFHYGIYIGLCYAFHLNYNVAYSLGYIISFIFNYFASSFFTFKENPNAQNGVMFAGAHLINYFVHMILLNVFIFIGIPNAFAPIFVFPIAIVINFFMVRFAFKKAKSN